MRLAKIHGDRCRRNIGFAGLGVVVVLTLGAGSASASVAVDKTVTTHQATAAGSIASPVFSTAAPGELLLAFITSDGPSGGGSQTFSKVTGGGLSWRLRRRANSQAGTAEIWAANASGLLTNATVTAARGSGSYPGSITVVTLTGADQIVDGSTAAAGAASGAPSVSLTTGRAGSWVWGVGNDWDRAAARTVGANQTKVDEFLPSVGDTMWVQRQASATPLGGTQVTLNDTAPSNDRWNLAAVEVLPAVTDTQAPTAPANLAAGAVTATQVPLSWSASTDDQGVAGYRIFRGAEQVGDVSGTSFTDTTVAPATAYTYTVKAYDAAGNASAASNQVSLTTPNGDATPPLVSLTAPAGGATVSGTAALAATASDPSGIAAVQFLLDGSPIGSEDTTAPYGLAWDSTAVANGSHTLAARARDGAGNLATSTPVSVTVANGGVGPAQVGQWGPLIPLPAVAIHSALLPSGRILLFQGDFATGGQQYVLDPQTGAVTHVPDAAADLFCAGQAVLADGRVLVVGGTATHDGLGVDNITAFDWQSQTWSELAPMHFPRWYATATTLSDGKVLAMSGDNLDENDIVPIPELYSPSTNTWQSLTQASHAMPIYPFIYQLPDGRIAHLGGSEVPTASEVLDLSTNKWTTIDSRVIDGGSIANYAPGRFIKAGSAADDGFSGNSLKTAYTLNMNAVGATWQPTASMAFPRSFLNLTNLPDGTVLATRWRDRQIGVRRRQRRAAGRGLESVDRGLDDLCGDDRPTPLPLGCGAPARWPGLRGGRRRRSRRQRPAKRSDLLAAVSLQGRAPDDQLGARHRQIRLEHVRRYPRRRLHLAGVADPHRLGHPCLRPERAGDRVELLRDRRRPQRRHAGQPQRRAARLLHALHRQRPGRAVCGVFRALPRTVRRYVGAHRADEPDGNRRRGLCLAQLDGRHGRHGGCALQRPPLEHAELHANRREPRRSDRLDVVLRRRHRAGTWYYKVTAEDGAGNVGPASAEASASASPDTTPPSVPAAFRSRPEIPRRPSPGVHRPTTSQ